jgi:outer membrane lipoprotein carrier protein
MNCEALSFTECDHFYVIVYACGLLVSVMIRFIRLTLFLIVLNVTSLAHARADDALIRILNGTQTLSARFVQLIYANNQVISRNSGFVLLQRPGKFLWHIETPSRQLLVADGQHIWFYDPQLHQATVKTQRAFDSNTPAFLLSSSGRALLKSFTVKKLNDYFQLYSKDKDALFHRIELVFKHDQLKQMRLFDNLGQRTVISFFAVHRNVHINPDAFYFKPPLNCEVVKQ